MLLVGIRNTADEESFDQFSVEPCPNVLTDWFVSKVINAPIEPIVPGVLAPVFLFNPIVSPVNVTAPAAVSV